MGLRPPLRPVCTLSLAALLALSPGDPAYGQTLPSTSPAQTQESRARPALTPRNEVAAADGAWDGTLTFGRHGHSAVYDAARDRMLVFGGHDGTSFRDDVRALALAGTPVWSRVTPTGVAPEARSVHAAIYDPVRDRMIVFGGWNGSLHKDVWALSLAGTPAWSRLAPTGAQPSERDWHSAVYDPVRDRMIVFGGWDGTCRNDVWALALGNVPAWSQLAQLPQFVDGMSDS